MKNILTIIIISILIFSCKKEEIKPDASTTQASKSVRVVVNSNFKYAYLAIERDTATIKRFNNGIYNFKTAVAIDTTFTILTPGRYRFYSHCSKNGTDSTAFMLDTKKIWNSMTIYIDGQIQYNKIDSVGQYGGGKNKIVSNECYFNL